MREGLRNFMVGITAIGALIGLAALLMSFGELDPLLNPRYKLTIIADNAAGLRPGGAVEYNGVPVGVVDTVFMIQDPQNPVRIVCLIDQQMRLPAEVKPFATAPLIGGSATLQLQAPPDSATGQFLPTDNSATLHGPIRGGLMAQITEQLDERMKPLTTSLEKFNKLSDTYVTLGESLNELVRPQSSAQLTQGEQPNLRTAVVKLNSALDEAREGLELAKKFLADEQLNTDVRSAVHKAHTLIDQATTAVQRYTELAESLQKDSKSLMEKLLPVADSVSTTLEEVRRLAKLANEGKGTVGQLLNNPDLYNSLTDAATRLERTMVELQLLIDKLRQEGVNINF
jgi:phospholipid/cholesterol/gamma-HCH transport system substrate-binding protein